MTLDEKVLGKYIKDMINKHVAEKDRRAFVESLTALLEEKVFLSDIDIEKKYADLLATLIHDVEFAKETEGINTNLLVAGIGHKYLLP